MVCKTHMDHNGVNTCSKCGEWICEDCSVDLNGRIFCKDCLSRTMHVPKSEATASTGACPGAGAAYGRRHYSWGLTLMFSLILPGLSYMYLGLVKRGVCALSAFFVSAYIASVFNLSLVGLFIPILWITTAFDAFNIRRRLNAGEHIEDNVNDALGFLKRCRLPLILLGGFLLGSNIIRQLGYYVSSSSSAIRNTIIYGGKAIAYSTPVSGCVWMVAQILSAVLPLVILGVIGYVLYRVLHKKRRPDGACHGEVVDTHDHDHDSNM